MAGEGTSANPWRVKFVDADQDTRDNYFLLEVDDTSRVSAPADVADAAATTRKSIELFEPNLYQRVYYDRTAEVVEIRGGEGGDTFISDDSMAAIEVHGEGGADNFLIGRVIDTRLVSVDGRLIEIVDGIDGITPGVSFNATFFGGTEKDYFEVNNNVGSVALFGEQGDDTIFLKAQLQERVGGSGDAGTGRPVDGSTNMVVDEIDGGMITAGAGDDQNQILATDTNDVLIDYVEKNRVEIFGGSGFDTVVVARARPWATTFYIFTDNGRASVPLRRGPQDREHPGRRAPGAAHRRRATTPSTSTGWTSP